MLQSCLFVKLHHRSRCTTVRTGYCLLIALSLCFLASTLEAHDPVFWRYTPVPGDDGAHYIWFYLNMNGMARPYIPTADFPSSRHYQQVDELQNGDIVWWPSFAVTWFASPEGESVLAWPEVLEFTALIDSLGTPQYYRPIDTDGDSLGARTVCFEAFGQKVMCTNPDPGSWLLEVSEVHEEEGVGLLWLKHTPIINAQGIPIEPICSIGVEKLTEPIPSLKNYVYLKSAEMGTAMQNKSQEGDMIIGYTQYGVGVVHYVIVGFQIIGNNGYRLICDSTADVYETVKDDMLAFVRSFQLIPPGD